MNVAAEKFVATGGILVAKQVWGTVGYSYTSMATREEAMAYALTHQARLGLYEVIPADEYVHALRRNKCAVQHPRLTLDLDHEVDGDGAATVDWEAVVNQIIAATNVQIAGWEGGAEQLDPVVYRLDNHREKSGGSYKFSTHLVWAHVTLQSWTGTGKPFVYAVHASLPFGGVAQTAMDIGINTRNRVFRFPVSAKDAASKPLVAVGAAAAVSPCDLLVGNYPVAAGARYLCLKTPKNAPGGAPSRRGGWGIRRGGAGAGGRYTQVVQNFLDTHETAQAMGWRGAQVQDEMYSVKTGEATLKVGFSAQGVARTCPEGTQHSGGANQYWLLRVKTLSGFALASKCYANSSGARCSDYWLTVRHPSTKRIVRLLLELR